MGRPRRLNGQRTRAISLDAETSDAADRMPNFSRFVREAVRAHMNGTEGENVAELPSARFAAILFTRMTAAAEKSREDPHDNNLRRYEALRDACLGFLSIDEAKRIND